MKIKRQQYRMPKILKGKSHATWIREANGKNPGTVTFRIIFGRMKNGFMQCLFNFVIHVGALSQSASSTIKIGESVHHWMSSLDRLISNPDVPESQRRPLWSLQNTVLGAFSSILAAIAKGVLNAWITCRLFANRNSDAPLRTVCPRGTARNSRRKEL